MLSQGTPITRSPSIDQLGVTSLRVRLIKLKDVRLADGRAPSTMKCFMRLESANHPKQLMSNDKQIESFDTEQIKSSALTKDRDDVISFNEVWFLEPLISLDSVFHLRVYEAGLFAENIFACEVSIPLRESLRRNNDSDANLTTAALAADVAKELFKARRQSSSSSISSMINEISTSKPTVQDIVSQFNSNRKDCIGINMEVVSWHSLYGTDGDKDKKLGEIKLGLSIVSR
jgi:hypothetical protein